MHNVTAIIPAYNEALRLPEVLKAVQAATLISEIIVVNDGSTDDTAQVASASGVRVVNLEENCGKGTALRAGALASAGDILLFLDADLHGIIPSQVDDLVRPVLQQKAEMAIGVFYGGRAATDLAQYLCPNISGQRCLFSNFFLSAPLIEGSRSGVEIAITIHARASKLQVQNVPLRGITHTVKEEKLGLVHGVFARMRMYLDILITLVRYTLITRLPGRTPVSSK
ncbi:MAG TPA: glycosyltransferase family 2 protein [Armatimonadota bacterium]